MRYTTKKRQNKGGNQGEGKNNKQTRADPNDGNVNVDQLLKYVTLRSGDVKKLKLRRWDRATAPDQTTVPGQTTDQAQQQAIYHGFTLHGKRTLVVTALEKELCDSSFLYKLYRGKLLVSAASAKQHREASKVEGDFQEITVWTYRGTNRDMQDLDDGIDYVFCGDNTNYKSACCI
ncbi:hypothetical protein OCU04_007234 [Sclerotinia nivalis]|uniref:Uncharacterized protein n=1 Tax=Sclerotinia nivalis TaxID=352851 RepID=A0A9X0ALE9_9HELO|nr:hypothetical protein OCU04_007234 [Sclerotinia nivalis]